MKILVSSWEAASAQNEAQNAAIIDADDPFSDLKESLQQLHDIDLEMVPEYVTPESLTDVDNEVIHNWLNHLVKPFGQLAKWFSVRLQTKWFWVRVKLQSLKHQISHQLRAMSSLTFRQL